jgi:superfamily II DNA or RNA helicase
MSKRTETAGSGLFIVDNSDQDWKVLRYLRDWCQISKGIDIATGYLEIGSLLALDGEWQKTDQIRILMGDEVSRRTKQAFVQGLEGVKHRLDASLESEKQKNDFLVGVPAIVEGIRSGKIACRVYRKDKFHAKAYITHARLDVVGSSALVGSSNFTQPGLTENVELNVQVTGSPVADLQEWYEHHWAQAEDVTADILRTIERHTRDYSPFDVYAKAMHELLSRQKMTDSQWLETESHVYPILDRYQRDGFYDLMETASRYRGAFLCDSVGLGKTFIGLMVIEYLVERQRKRVALIVPKTTRQPVWERDLRRYLPHIFGDFSNLVVFNHTDLLRGGSFPRRLERLKEMADAFLIDEAHHFRNPGVKGEPGDRKSRYWQLYDIAEGKTLYMLTATPINNRLLDLQHMMEIFSRRQPDYFKDAPLGIHSLPGHFRRMEKELETLVYQESGGGDGAGVVETNQAEAEQVLSNDALFRALVVQRSRAYVRESQKRHGGTQVMFPTREDPRVQPYSIKKTYGSLLSKVEQAFNNEKPLFSLAIYYPLAYYTGPDTSINRWVENRQKQVVGLIRIQFLKRFESSVSAFNASCQTLLLKLLAWLDKNSPEGEELRRFERWKTKYSDLLDYVRSRQRELEADASEDADEDVVPEEMREAAEKLDRKEYKVDEIINETIDDLYQLAEFTDELRKFKPSHDDKLRALVRLLKTDPVLTRHKVIVFTEFMDTARYLEEQLKQAGIEGVDEVDSESERDRGEIIRRFAPYYNDSSSAGLGKEGETRVLISTDVLSEGLNLQDATRLINYDIHWNPVRLMQRIGRVDRRMDPGIEAGILKDHPDQAAVRGTVVFWNFLPPDELDDMLRLYRRVAHKTLRISKTFGIEGKKLLKPEDDYEALKDFTHNYEGETSPVEKMRLEYEALLRDNPGLEERLNSLPGRVFSGKEHPKAGSRAVFFCYALPAADLGGDGDAEGAEVRWTEEAGTTKWYLFDLDTEKVADEPSAIVDLIRCQPDTPRHCTIERPTLSEIRGKIEKHIKNTYLKQVQAPVGVKATLKAWMELS